MDAICSSHFFELMKRGTELSNPMKYCSTKSFLGPVSVHLCV